MNIKDRLYICITSENLGRPCDGASAESNSRCEPPPSECTAVRVAARRRRCKKGRVSRDGPGGGAGSALVRFGHAPPRLPPRPRRRAGTPHPRNRCGRVAAPRNEIAARASTSRQALRTSSCFPVTPRIAAVAPVVVVNRHSSSLPVNAPLRRRRHRRRENDIRDRTFDCPRTKSGRAADDNILLSQ